MSQEVTEGDLKKALADEALLKLSSRGVRKCQITPAASEVGQAFWSPVGWIQPDAPDHQDPPDDQTESREPATDAT